MSKFIERVKDVAAIVTFVTCMFVIPTTVVISLLNVYLG